MGSRQRPGTDPRDGGCGSEATDSLLEQDQVTLLWSRPHRRDNTTAGAEHPGNLAGGCGPVDDIHQAQRGEQHVVRPLISWDRLAATLTKTAVGKS